MSESVIKAPHFSTGPIRTEILPPIDCKLPLHWNWYELLQCELSAGERIVHFYRGAKTATLALFHHFFSFLTISLDLIFNQGLIHHFCHTRQICKKKKAQHVVDEHIYIQFKLFTVKQSRSSLNIYTGPRCRFNQFLNYGERDVYGGNFHILHTCVAPE